jgi:hypothetical protein
MLSNSARSAYASLLSLKSHNLIHCLDCRDCARLVLVHEVNRTDAIRLDPVFQYAFGGFWPRAGLKRKLNSPSDLTFDTFDDFIGRKKSFTDRALCKSHEDSMRKGFGDDHMLFFGSSSGSHYTH